MTKLAPGDKAPQFIIFSFDGAGSHQRWNEFMAAAESTNSRFTGFLSGIYLLGDSAKNAGAYTGPGHATGKSSIGYGGPESEIVTEVNDLNMAYSKGMRSAPTTTATSATTTRPAATSGTPPTGTTNSTSSSTS